MIHKKIVEKDNKKDSLDKKEINKLYNVNKS